MNLERAPEDTVTLADSVVRLNEQIEKDGEVYNLDRQYFIAQGQFSGLPVTSRISAADEQLVREAWELEQQAKRLLYVALTRTVNGIVRFYVRKNSVCCIVAAHLFCYLAALRVSLLYKSQSRHNIRQFYIVTADSFLWLERSVPPEILGAPLGSVPRPAGRAFFPLIWQFPVLLPHIQSQNGEG